MNKVYIKSISIQGFRGINNQLNPLVILFNVKGVTSIFAENGKGKSSIFEALYYCLNNCFPKLDSLHREIRDDKSKRNLFYNGDGKIKINFIDDKAIETEINFSINQNGERIISGNSICDPQIFLDKLDCSHSFLDYNTFIKILLNSPEETGKLFSDLVGFAEFPLLKEKLEKISRSQNVNSDFQKTSKEGLIIQNKLVVKDNKIRIVELLNEIGNALTKFDEQDIHLLLKRIIKSDFGSVITNFHSIQSEDLIKNRAGDQYNENVQLLNSLENEIDIIHKYLRCIKAFRVSELAAMRKQLGKAYAKVKGARELYSRDLFEQAIVIYEKFDLDRDTCVLCETAGLNKSSVSFFEQLQSKSNKFKDLKENLELIKDEFKKLIERQQFLQIEDYLAHVNLISLEEKIISKFYHSGKELSDDFFEDKKIETSLKKYKGLLQNKIKTIKSQTKLLYTKVPKDLPELINKSIKIKEIVNKLIDCAERDIQIKKDEIYLSMLTEWIEFTSDIKGAFENSFNDLMANISTDINKETKDFFYGLMKNSDISPLIIKESRGQKVNILLDRFYSAGNKKASSLLSESYRNALCLSIYFASALKSKSRGNFLVLDDVCSSFDSGHQYFLLDLIRDKISRIATKHGRQVIFLTHDGLLKKALPKYSSDKWTHYSLSGNRAEMSVRPYTSDDFKNLLINKINNGENIGSDIRAFYESVLIEIIEELNIQIPFNLIGGNDKKIINELLNALNDIVQLKVKAKKTKIKNLPTKLDFKTYLQDVGNILSHFASASTSSLSQSALVSYVNSIVQIRQRFQYNCTCLRNLGWVYYKTLEGGKKDKGCTCTI